MGSTSVASILSSKDHLARAVDELSKHLDAAGRAINALGDTDPRTGIVHAAKLNRERLTKTMLELSQSVEKLPTIQQELAEAAARRRGQTANQDQLETVTQETSARFGGTPLTRDCRKLTPRRG